MDRDTPRQLLSSCGKGGRKQQGTTDGDDSAALSLLDPASASPHAPHRASRHLSRVRTRLTVGEIWCVLLTFALLLAVATLGLRANQDSLKLFQVTPWGNSSTANASNPFCLFDCASVAKP